MCARARGCVCVCGWVCARVLWLGTRLCCLCFCFLGCWSSSPLLSLRARPFFRLLDQVLHRGHQVRGEAPAPRPGVCWVCSLCRRFVFLRGSVGVAATAAAAAAAAAAAVAASAAAVAAFAGWLFLLLSYVALLVSVVAASFRVVACRVLFPLAGSGPTPWTPSS